MFVKLKVARAGAIKMGLPTPDDCGVVKATLSVVELAGRLTLATGRVIAPEAVTAYLAGTRRARLALECILQSHDRADLALRLASRSCQRMVWSPEDVDGVIAWLACVLLVRFFNSDRKILSDKEALKWAQSVTIDELADLCESNFGSAFGLWIQGECEDESGLPAPRSIVPFPL